MSTQNPPPTVLLVEDDAFVRLLAAEMVSDAGFRVLEAPDADVALQIMADHGEVGILLTDVHMPGSMDGVRLAQIVHERWPEVELIITSGRLRPNRAEIPDEGIFIPKPYSEGQLLTALNTMARRAAP